MVYTNSINQKGVLCLQFHEGKYLLRAKKILARIWTKVVSISGAGERKGVVLQMFCRITRGFMDFLGKRLGQDVILKLLWKNSSGDSKCAIREIFVVPHARRRSSPCCPSDNPETKRVHYPPHFMACFLSGSQSDNSCV